MDAISTPIGATDVKQVAKGYSVTTVSQVGNGFGYVPAELPILSFYILDKTQTGFAFDFTGDFYYRIWVIPNQLVAINPRVGVPVPFKIWNAFPWQNSVKTIKTENATGLTLDLDSNRKFFDLELIEPSITITPNAPASISARYDFEFDWGEGTLFFSASISNILAEIPEYPVQEMWAWKTDILRAVNAVEQRVSLRSSPRRSASLIYPVDVKEQWRDKYLTLFTKLTTRITIPFPQYMTEITRDSDPGDGEIWFDTARTDVRANEYLILVDRQTERASLLKIEEIITGGVKLDQLLSFPVYKNMLVMPGFSSRIADGIPIQMGSVVGQTTIRMESMETRLGVSRPGSSAIIRNLHDYPILEKRPLVREAGVGTTFFSGYEVIDSKTGIQSYRSLWPHAYPTGDRSFIVQRHFYPEEMDWWRDFFERIAGKQKAFFASTWRHDFELAEEILKGDTSIKIKDMNYTSSYFPNKCCKYLQFELDNGEIYHSRVLDSADNVDEKYAVLRLEGALPDIPKTAIVSFLHLTRLDDDSVLWEHHQTYSILTIRTRLVDQ